MADKRTIRRAFEQAKSRAFSEEDPKGSWQWKPSPFEAFRLGYEAAERVLKEKEPK